MITPGGDGTEGSAQRSDVHDPSAGAGAEAAAAGAPAAPSEVPDDDLWWVRSLGGPAAPAQVHPVLPAADQLRREVAALPSTLGGLDAQDEVRAVVAALNARIAESSAAGPDEGSPDGVPEVDVEEAVARWSAARTRRDEPVAAAPRRRPWRRRGGAAADGPA